MSECLIEHSGKIVKILDDNLVQVVIDAKSACSDCHSKSACGLADLKKKIIDVKTDGRIYNKGDDVVVVLEEKMGFTAVFYAYILPLIVIVSSLVGCNIVGYSDEIAGLLSIIVFLTYYFLLYLFRKKIAKYFIFNIKV